MAADTPDTATAQQPPGSPQKRDGSAEPPQVAITGDTYPLRAQLKAMGAVWDNAARVWKIAPERAAQAQALVDQRPADQRAAAETPFPAARPSTPSAYEGAAAPYEEDPLADLPDPFEEAEAPVPLVALSGNTYPVKEALKALGAHWDKEQRAWLIAANKAAHAQAIIDNQGNQQNPALTAAAFREAPGEA